MFALAALLLVQAGPLPQKQLLPEVTFDLAAVDEIQYVGAVVEGPGGVYVTDPWAPGVFRFDSTGRPAGRIGRTGGGPGEYRFPSGIGRRGDSLWVWDVGQSRVLIYGADGRPVRTISLTRSGSGLATFFADGSFAVIPTWNSERAAPGAPATLPVLRFAPDGALRDTLLELDVELGQMQMDLPNGEFIISPQPFGDSPRMVGAGRGDGLIRVDRPTTGPAVITVRQIGTDGRTRWTREIPFPPAPVDPALVDSIVRQSTRLIAPDLPRVEERVARAAIRIPPRVVAVLGVASAPDGTIWLQRPVPVGSPARYTVLGPDGAPRSEVLLPPGGKLVGLGIGRVYVVSLDEDDLPRLSRYRVQ